MRSLQALCALLWGVSISSARSRGLMLLLLAQGLLWTTLARKASLSPPDSFLSAQAVPDIATIAMWTVCFTGTPTAFRARSLMPMLLASPAPRSLIALSMVLPGSLLGVLIGSIPFCIGLPEAIPGIWLPLCLLAFAVSGTAVGLTLALPSRDSLLGAGALVVLLLACHSSLAYSPPPSRLMDFIAFGFLRRHMQNAAPAYDTYILAFYTVCVYGLIVRHLSRSWSPKG